MQPSPRPTPAPKSLKSSKSTSRSKRRVLVAHACRNGPCRYFVQSLILAFLLCALGLMAYSLHLRLYSPKLASMSSSPSSPELLHDTKETRALLASLDSAPAPPLPPLVPLAAVKNRSLLLFSVMRDYNPHFAATAAVEYARYTLSLTSWQSLSTLVAAAKHGEYSVGRVDVVLFVDSRESCTHLSASWPSVLCRVSGSLRNESEQSDSCVRELSKGSRPHLNCIWRHIADHSRTSGHKYDDLLYVNGDILLFPSMLDTLTLVHRSYPAANASYAVVTRRRDASFAALTPAALTPQQLTRTQRHFTANSSDESKSASELHDPFGIDAFLLSSAAFPSIASHFPQLLVGSSRWDNWLLATLLRDSSATRPVVDATAGWVVGHDSGPSEHDSDEGRKWNEAAVKLSMGKWWRVGTVDNADIRVAKGGAHNGSSVGGLRLEMNSDERAQVKMYRYISMKQVKEQQAAHSDKV